MDGLLVKVIVVAVILLVIAGIVVPRVRGRRVDTKRPAAMAAVASSQGWTFIAEDESLAPVVEHLPRATGTASDMILSKLMRDDPPRRAVGSRIWNVLDGNVEGRRLRVFDWTVGQASGSGRASLVYVHTVWAIAVPGLQHWVQAASMSQPFDEWRPGQWFKIGDAAFDKRFRTTCEDSSHLAAGPSPQTRRLLLESGFDGWRLDPDLQMLVVWTHSMRGFTPAEQIVALTRQAVRLAADAAETPKV